MTQSSCDQDGDHRPIPDGMSQTDSDQSTPPIDVAPDTAVIDHHPSSPATRRCQGYPAGTTDDVHHLTEHLRAVDVNISERTATAMLYAIKSDTLFFNRQTNRVDLERFSYLYPRPMPR